MNDHKHKLKIQMCVKKVRVGTVQYLKWIQGFTTWKKRIGINLIPVTISQYNQIY
jgi:hypothetical protein